MYLLHHEAPPSQTERVPLLRTPLCPAAGRRLPAVPRVCARERAADRKWAPVCPGRRRRLLIDGHRPPSAASASRPPAGGGQPSTARESCSTSFFLNWTHPRLILTVEVDHRSAYGCYQSPAMYQISEPNAPLFNFHSRDVAAMFHHVFRVPFLAEGSSLTVGP